MTTKINTSVLKDQAYIRNLEDKVKHLEDLLQSANLPIVGSEERSHEEQIIRKELRALHHQVVVKHNFMDRDELRKFETLVKCLVQLRSSEKSDAGEASEEEFLGDEHLLELLSKGD